MRNKNIIILVLILLTAALPVSAATVEVSESIRDDISIDENVTGTITPVEQVNLSAEVGGTAEEVKVEVGDQVAAGDKLVEIDDRNLLIQKKQAEGSLESAEANLKELKSGVTEEEYTRVKASYQEAEDNLESAETNLELMEEIYNNRRSLKQQLVGAEQQLRNSEQQLENSKENLRQAEINHEQAEREYERSKKLYNDDVISEREFEEAKNSYENSKSSLENAKNSVEQAETSLNTAEKDYQLSQENYDNPTELKQQLENARSQVKAAESGLEVAEANLEEAERGAREEQIQAAAAQVKQSEAGLDEIEYNLSKTEITAPFSGIVNEVRVEAGEMIGNSQVVINLIDLSQLYVEIEVAADIVSTIKKGDTVEVKAETMQHFIEGEIEQISPTADQSSRAFLVKVKIDNSDHSLRAGMFADVKISRGEAGNTVVVPLDSVVDLNGDNPHVFVVEDGKAVRKDVEIGLTTSNQVEIKEGVEAGKEVVIKGQSELKDETEVEVRN